MEYALPDALQHASPGTWVCLVLIAAAALVAIVRAIFGRE